MLVSLPTKAPGARTPPHNLNNNSQPPPSANHTRGVRTSLFQPGPQGHSQEADVASPGSSSPVAPLRPEPGKVWLLKPFPAEGKGLRGSGAKQAQHSQQTGAAGTSPTGEPSQNQVTVPGAVETSSAGV